MYITTNGVTYSFSGTEHFFVTELISFIEFSPYNKSLANIQSDVTKAKTVESPTEGQRETLEWVAGAMGMSGNPSQGVTVSQVANAQFQDHNRPATAAERSVISKQLERLYSEGLLSRSKVRGVWHYLHPG